MEHIHAKAIDRIGRDDVREFFSCTVRTIQLWCANGIPKTRHNAFKALAKRKRTQVPELDQ